MFFEIRQKTLYLRNFWDWNSIEISNSHKVPTWIQAFCLILPCKTVTLELVPLQFDSFRGGKQWGGWLNERNSAEISEFEGNRNKIGWLVSCSQGLPAVAIFAQFEIFCCTLIRHKFSGGIYFSGFVTFLPTCIRKSVRKIFFPQMASVWIIPPQKKSISPDGTQHVAKKRNMLKCQKCCIEKHSVVLWIQQNFVIEMVPFVISFYSFLLL